MEETKEIRVSLPINLIEWLREESEIRGCTPADIVLSALGKERLVDNIVRQGSFFVIKTPKDNKEKMLLW